MKCRLRLWRLLVAVCLLAGLTTSAGAQQSGVSTTTSTSALSVTSGNCLSANGYRRSLTLDNSGGTINIGYCLSTPGGSACTAAIGTPPTKTIYAGSTHFYPAGSAPQGQICFVSASGTPSITIEQGQ